MLNDVQKKHGDRVVILAICLDGPEELDSHGHALGNHGEDGHDRHDHDEHHSAAPADFGEIRNKVERFVRSKGMTYRILLDPKSEVGRQFLGGELPTNVIIDSQGRICRRFVGSRPLAAFEAMLEVTEVRE